LPRRSKPSRVVLLTRVVFGMFVLAALSQARVQIVERNSIIDRATSTDRFMITRVEEPKRGLILTSDGKPLAEDEDTRVLNVDFRKIPRSNGFFMDISAATGIPAAEFMQLANSSVKHRTWRQPISAAEAKALQQVKTSWRADGISLAPSGRRVYPLGEAAASFVGVIRDGRPQGGLESGDNQLLSGKPGRLVGLVDRSGNFLPTRLDSRSSPPRDGENITLTIDSELQTVAYDAIKKAVQDNKADQGVAIVINPSTGDLLAMANWPSYDPNAIGNAQAPTQHYGFNPNYMAVLEPGSMFKILTLAKAFDKGVVTDNDFVACHGTLMVGKRSISCDSHHGNRAHGLLDPTMAIAKSCNVSAATWALRIGYDDYVRYMEQLGIMSRPNLGLPGERAGLFNYNDPAQQLHLATLGFGQSVNATPVQLAGAFAMLANQGLRMQPRLIKRLGDKDIPPVALGQIIRPETAEHVLTVMQSVIQSDAGTGKDLRIPGYILGGKTGTAQKVNRATHSMRGGGYVSNFVGFVPGDKPQAVILVMIDNPKAGQYYGASVAGPVFVRLARTVIRRMDIPPDAPFDAEPQSLAEHHAGPGSQLIHAPAVSPAEVKAQMKEWEQSREKLRELVHQSNPVTGALNADDSQTTNNKRRERRSVQPDPAQQLMPTLDSMLSQSDQQEDKPRRRRHHHHRRTD